MKRSSTSIGGNSSEGVRYLLKGQSGWKGGRFPFKLIRATPPPKNRQDCSFETLGWKTRKEEVKGRGKEGWGG